MKKLIATLAACLALAGYSRAQTNSYPFVWSPVFDMLGQSNLVAGTYAMYDSTDKSWGGGAFLGYKLTEMVMPMFRMDYVRQDAYAVSGNLQLQLPIDIGRSATRPEGLFRLTPLTFAGIATSWNNQDNGNDLGVIGIFGAGFAITIKADHAWWVPSGLAFDWERWAGAGFNDTQYRFGPFWKF